MKRFFKLNVFALVALLFLGVADVWGIGINKNVSLNLRAEADMGSWDPSTKTLGWKQLYSNLYFLNDWNDCDLSGYDKMVVKVSNVSRNNEKYRVVLKINETDYTCVLEGSGEKIINIR